MLDIQANLPGVNQATLNSLRGQLETKNNLDLLNLRLDYQVRPYLNIYGSIGKITDKTEVDFSALMSGISPMEVNNGGTAYTVGARLNHQYGEWLTSLNFAHSRLDLDNNSEAVKVNSFVPSLGRKTDYGVFSGSLLYQDVEASYAGTITVPIVGAIPVTVETENKDELQIMAGWQKALAKDLFISADIGLNGKKQFHLQLNKRF